MPIQRQQRAPRFSIGSKRPSKGGNSSSSQGSDDDSSSGVGSSADTNNSSDNTSASDGDSGENNSSNGGSSDGAAEDSNSSGDDNVANGGSAANDENSDAEGSGNNDSVAPPSSQPEVKPEPVVNSYGVSIGGLTDGEIESLVQEWLNSIWRPKQQAPTNDGGWHLDEWGVWGQRLHLSYWWH